jgi:hypothetical protein
MSINIKNCVTIEEKRSFPKKIVDKAIHVWYSALSQSKPRIFSMNLAQALKQKNRLAGEINRQQQILQRENARRSDSTSSVDRQAVLDKILELSTQLGELKAKIAKANVGIYPAIERMAEFKSLIGFFQTLNKRVGEEIVFVGRDNEKLTYKWDSLVTQESTDARVAELQAKINALQDEVDTYNATTQI